MNGQFFGDRSDGRFHRIPVPWLRKAMVMPDLKQEIRIGMNRSNSNFCRRGNKVIHLKVGTEQ